MGDRPPGDAPLYLKIAAGLTTGALAIAIASPTDLVKVERAIISSTALRIQAERLICGVGPVHDGLYVTGLMEAWTCHVLTLRQAMVCLDAPCRSGCSQRAS